MFNWSVRIISLTLRLLISYIYGAPSKARNANVVYIYGPTFGSAETVSFYLLHNVSALPNVGPYTGCPRRNVKYFGRVFLMLNYADITQNTYIQS